MKNLKSIIQYECMTSFKYIWIFYAIQYVSVGFITIMVGLIMGAFEDVGTSGLEINTLIYIGILGALGFKEDFKMLIQHGFTRKYIFIATLSMFGFISGIMAFIDTLVGNLIHHFNNSYSTFYGGIYGYDNLFMNWLWLFLLYMVVCCLLYFAISLIHKVGKIISICLGIALGSCILMLIASFQYIFSYVLTNNIINFFMKIFGFMPDGTINYIFPVLTLLLMIGIFASSAYLVIRHIELK